MFHIPVLHRPCHLEELIRQHRLSMVDVRYDAEVPDIGVGTF